MVVRGKMLGIVNGMRLIYRVYFVPSYEIKPVYEPHTNRQLWKSILTWGGKSDESRGHLYEKKIFLYKCACTDNLR